MGEGIQERGPESAVTGVICALPAELGGLAGGRVGARQRQGLELLELDCGGAPLLACISGVGKVRAARAATILLAEGVARLLVVGTCGGLKRHLTPGTLLHCRKAIQADLGVREGRESLADPEILSHWRREAPGGEGTYLTADKAVLSPWRRLRLARALRGDCVADMETAAVAAVAEAAGAPWGALRAVTDGAGWFGSAAFRVHYPVQAGRAADTIPGLLNRLAPPRRIP